MANIHLANPDLVLNNFSGTGPVQDAEYFVQLIESKINFPLGNAPAEPVDLTSYTAPKKALSSTLLQGPVAECFRIHFEKAATWATAREQFITRTSDRRNKFWHRMEIEHCVSGDGG